MCTYKENDILIDKLKVIKYLGGGNYGSVYEVEDINLNNTRKAVKVIKLNGTEKATTVLSEAKALQKCRHTNVVEIYGADRRENNIYISMKFLSEGTLQSKIDKDFLSAVDIWRYFIDALFGLECIHSKKLLHRDIKPANLLLDNGIAVISDLGLCTEYDNNYIGDLHGYITHIAPEAFKNNQTSKLTDIYAIGLTMFRCVNNIKDWLTKVRCLKNSMDVIRNGRIIKNIGYEDYCPKKLKTIINKACNPDPQKRYQNAKEMREALTRLKPKINWRPETGTRWIGKEYNNPGNTYTIELFKKKKIYNVLIKKNKRKIDEKSFNSEIQAFEFLYEHIRNSSFY